MQVTTFDRVRDLMAHEFHLDPTDIHLDTPLIDLGVDSLAALEFAFDLEEAFRVTLEAQTDLRTGTVKDVVAAVEAALAVTRVESPAD